MANLRPCAPADVLGLQSSQNQVMATGAAVTDLTSCPYDCRHVYYDTRITEGRFDHLSTARLFGSDPHYQEYSAE